MGYKIVIAISIIVSLFFGYFNDSNSHSTNQIYNNTKNLKSSINNYRINLINQCPVTILTAALGPTKIKPMYNQSWVLGPGETLSFSIPKEWESTAGMSTINGPRFWARVGCAYDIDLDIASCEGGDCGNRYDCSNASLAGSPPGSWAEFCFNCGNNLTYYDVSLVDGSHMSLDIQPINPSLIHSGNPYDPFWCKTNLCNKGQDLRNSSNCPFDFQLLNTDLKNHNPNTAITVTACFSNCGKWAYLKGLLGGNVKCDPNNPEPNPENEEICQNWRIYCCQSPTSGQKCQFDSDCQFQEACWNGACQCRAFYIKTCNPNICTHPYCECNDLVNKCMKNNHLKSCDPSVCPQGFSTQPIPNICTLEQGCIGDDTFHQVCTQAYSWPNDPQTYDCDSIEYNITFCPNGTNVNIANSINKIPDCFTLEKFPEYGYNQAVNDCSIPIKNGKLYACARKINDGLWACGINIDASCYNLGVLCKFNSTN
uniref:Uncharacterized protein n=1 Tax=viral metagenome TaxID=1070528 RepID=A0A6C0LT40_9ZZZZ